MNNPTQTFKEEYITYGVLETACWPCKWYVGKIRKDFGEWLTCDNQTGNFFKLEEEANKRFLKMREKSNVAR